MKEIRTAVYDLLNLSVSEHRVLSRVQNKKSKRSVSMKESSPLLNQKSDENSYSKSVARASQM
jgi:hypothetical protein